MELEVLGDRYELQEPIGRGGMATIYRAIDLRMGRTVAVKILREVYSSDPKFVTRFQREARAASALQHPNIVQVFDYGQSGESYYIIMEFVEGIDLRRYLKKRGMLDNERAIEIAHDVALGLGAAHKRGIVHRDVKPQNVMLNDDELVKLTDFGIASMYKDAEAERLTTTGMTLGTVQYYAPEQAQGEVVAPAADIYALGIVMYEMLAGRTPFDGDTPVAVAMKHIQEQPEPPSIYNPRIAPGLERIIMRCLEKNPADRYRDGDALAYALENYNRGPQRRGTGATAVPTGRPQFAPFGLPGIDGRQGADESAIYGGPSAISGPPAGTRVQSQPIPGGYGAGPAGYSATLGDAPTYAGYETEQGQGGINTRPYGPAGGTLPRTGRISNPYGVPQDDEGGKGRGRGPIISIITAAAALLLLLICFAVFALTGLGNSLGSAFGGGAPKATVAQQTTVPNFVGQTYDQAQAAAQTAHLQVTESQAPSTQAVGTVINQSSPAGSSVAYNSVIQLTVSSGPGKATVPDVTNQPLQTAEATLAEAGFTNVKAQPEPSSAVPYDAVIKTDPAANSNVDTTTTIIIYYSNTQATPTPTPSPTATATPTVTGSPTATPSGTPGKQPGQ